MKISLCSGALVLSATFAGLLSPCNGIDYTIPSSETVDKLRAKYPDRVPVIVQKAPKSTIPDIDQTLFMVPLDLTVAQFMYIIRKRIQLPPEKPLFLFVNKVLPTTSATMGSIYEEHKAENGFLYIYYSGHNTFG